MASIIDFLEARIAEDDAAAREVETDFEFDPSNPLRSALDVYAPGYDTYPVISIDSTRVLAECAAKRTIIAECREDHEDAISSRNDVTEVASKVLYALAAVYKDHPDYRQEWARG